MELEKMTSEPAVGRKRPLAVRDFPPGCGPCGIKGAERKSLKVLQKIHSDLGKFIKLVESAEGNKSSSSKPKELGGNGSSVVARPAGSDEKPKVTANVGMQGKVVNNFDSNMRKNVDNVESNTRKNLDNVDSCMRKNLNNVDSSTRKKLDNVESSMRKNLDNVEADTRKKLDNVESDTRKKLENVDSNMSKRTLNDGEKDKLVNTQPVENIKLKSSVPKELGRNKSYLASRTTKTMLWDPNSEPQKPEVTTGEGKDSRKEEVRREKIKEAIAMFDKVFESLQRENRSKPKGQYMAPFKVPLEAAKIVKRKLNLMDPGKIIGPVCGVQIGDKFKYRAQLMMIGLHCQHQSGIDFTKIGGENLATSVVDAHRYLNESGSNDTLVYSGQGGISMFSNKSAPAVDQELKTGNLALKNSMEKKTPVRVIRKVFGYSKELFAYDGLYTVIKCVDEKSAEGKIQFKFHLSRVPGQPSLQSMLKW